MSDYLRLLAAAAAAYLCGSFNTAVLVSRAVLRRDIRELGSGNAGFTNSMRAMGRRWGAVVIAGDLLKGALAILIATLLLYGSPLYDLSRATAALCVVLGHAYPVFFGFRGGKGVATTAAVMLMFDWRAALSSIGVYIIVSAATRYSSLGSILAAACLPLFVALFRPGEWIILAVASVIAGMLLFWHRANIRRLVQGTENKMTYRKKKP